MFKKLLISIIASQLVLYPTSRGGDVTAPVETAVPFSLVRTIRAEINQNREFYYPESALSPQNAIAAKSAALISMQDLIQKLKNPAVSFDSIKAEMVDQVRLEEEAQLMEMDYLIERMTPGQMDTLFKEASARGGFSRDLKAAYKSAYTVSEKQAVLMQLAREEFGRIRTNTMKKIGFLDRAQLLKDVEATRSIINVKGKDAWLVAVVIVLAVAVSGLVAWGVVSATKTKYERKTKEAEEEFKGKNAELEKKYADKEAALRKTFDDRRRLREEGYVWGICSTREQVQNVTCSYDKRSHGGNVVCVTKCMRNPATGDSLMHQETCTSAAIPMNCYDRNPTDAGFEDGYKKGDDDGYSRGYDDAYKKAYESYYDVSYDNGFGRGYDVGYNKGYSDGIKGTSYNNTSTGLGVGGNPEELKGFDKGYKEGYSQSLQ